MKWFRRKKREKKDPVLEFAKFFVAGFIDPIIRKQELERLNDMLLIPGVSLYYKGGRISPKHFESIKEKAATDFTVFSIKMNS